MPAVIHSTSGTISGRQHLRASNFCPALMASASPSQPYDYTEGASAIDIGDAVARARRDSSHCGDTGQGAMFDGPVQESIPTSMSRMSHTERGMTGRRIMRSRSQRSEDSIGRTSRRRSIDSQASPARTGAEQEQEQAEEGDDDEYTRHRGRGRRGSLSLLHNRSSVFENIAHLFSRGTGERRPSLSRRSSVSSTRRSRRRSSEVRSEYALESGDEVDERWGYSSGEESEETESNNSRPSSPIHGEIDYGSYPPSPRAGSHLPLFSPDPIFGDEVRIDIDMPREPLNPPPPGPPSRQTIFITEEDNTIRFVGYEVIIWRQWLWRACCVITFGVVGLLGQWFPRIWLRCIAQEKAFKDLKHGFVVVEVRNANKGLVGIQSHLPSVGAQRHHAIPRQTASISIRTINGFSYLSSRSRWTTITVLTTEDKRRDTRNSRGPPCRRLQILAFCT